MRNRSLWKFWWPGNNGGRKERKWNTMHRPTVRIAITFLHIQHKWLVIFPLFSLSLALALALLRARRDSNKEDLCAVVVFSKHIIHELQQQRHAAADALVYTCEFLLLPHALASLQWDLVCLFRSLLGIEHCMLLDLYAPISVFSTLDIISYFQYL